MSDADDPVPTEGGRSAAGRHVRGSTLLLGGRMLALGLNFVTQVATVRYLAKDDFGALAWALAVVGVGTSINLLGLSKGVSRRVPLHEERGEHGRALGAVLGAAGAIAGLGAALVVCVLGFRLLTGRGLVADPRAAELLLWLVALTPLHALDHLLQSVSAVFLGARAIFFRRHVLGPLLRLAAILSVIAVGGSVVLLAATHLVIGLVGVAAYLTMLTRHARRAGLWAAARAQGLDCEARALFADSLPLLSSDLVLVLQASVAVFVLERTHGATEVAALRAVAPVAALCLTAIESFKFLYVPATTRLFARGDHAGIGHVYWSTALWISVASFPVFAVACFLADPVIHLLFGERYASSGTLLVLLALGNYFNACTGLNAYTLQVYGRGGLILGCNAAAAAANVLYCAALVPRHGALGAALATAASVVTLNVLCQVALVRTTRVGAAPRAALVAYARIGAATAALAALAYFARPGALALLAAIAGAWALLVHANRHALDVTGTFPALAKLAPGKLFGRLRGQRGGRA